MRLTNPLKLPRPQSLVETPKTTPSPMFGEDPRTGAGDEARTRDINLGKGDEIICRVAKSDNKGLQPLFKL